MFPLGTVLLPGMLLPLRLFEDRYLALLREIQTSPNGRCEFGVVLIARGSEVGGGDQRCMVATVAEIVNLRTLADASVALLARGTDRIRIIEWLPDNPYPMAETEIWPDEPSETQDLDARIGMIAERIRTLNIELDQRVGHIHSPVGEVENDPGIELYRLAAIAPLGAADQHKLLSAPGLAARIKAFELALDDVAAISKFRSSL